MLKGIATITTDKFGRIRIPVNFLRTFRERYGNEVFITTIDQKNVLIYPLSEWEKINATLSVRIKNGQVLEDPRLKTFAMIINRFGMKEKFDKQGRILINKPLRDVTNLKGEILIEGRENHFILSKSS